MRPAALLSMLLLACTGEEAARFTLPVQVDDSQLAPVDNDLGWTVTLTAARLVAGSLELTIAGESHAKKTSPLEALRDFAVGRARAHPGHLADGDVAGELVGPVLVDWFAPDKSALGLATLFEGDYEGANLRLVTASTEHGLEASDPLVGFGAYLAGVATRADRTVRFEARLAAPEPALIVGLPFSLRASPSSRTTLGLALSPRDPIEGDTLFDGLDFGALADLSPAAEGQPILLSDAANNRLRRAFFTHDFFSLTSTPSEAP